jgi:hypothetical protein
MAASSSSLRWLVSMLLVAFFRQRALAAAMGHAWWLFVGVVPLIALGMLLGGFAQLADPKKIAPHSRGRSRAGSD